MLFNEQGVLNLDEEIMKNPSWQRIMEDNVVTDEELVEQAHIVEALLKSVDKTLNDEQKQLVEKLLAEISVLFAVHHIHELQSIPKF